MKLLKKITILLCFLSLIAFVSCSAEDKSGVKEKDNADGTEITGGGKSGNSGTGGTSGTGEGSGTGGTSGTGGSSGTGGGTETTETGNFPPPAGTYRDDNVWNEWKKEIHDTKVSTVGNTTKINGLALGDNGKWFNFDISKWKKTIKDGKNIKSEAIVEKDYGKDGYKDISIVYYYDSSTLEITFKYDGYVKDCLFKGTKISE